MPTWEPHPPWKALAAAETRVGAQAGVVGWGQERDFIEFFKVAGDLVNEWQGIFNSVTSCLFWRSYMLKKSHIPAHSTCYINVGVHPGGPHGVLHGLPV